MNSNQVRIGEEIYTLLQDAFCVNESTYGASAVDKNGRQGFITWAIKNFETENEDETCDWENPESFKY